MAKPSKLLKEGRKNELWERYCGYINLDKAEFMDIQKRLLLEQLVLVGASKIGQVIFGDNIPKSIEEFRQNIPLTTYEDYENLLADRNEGILPAKPMAWMRTSGRT